MRTILLLLILIAVPVSGWAEDVIFEDISVHEWMPAVCCTPSKKEDCVECDQPTKRQELIEKCDEAILKYSECRKKDSGCPYQFTDVKVYCFRASLEDKQ